MRAINIIDNERKEYDRVSVEIVDYLPAQPYKGLNSKHQHYRFPSLLEAYETLLELQKVRDKEKEAKP